MLMGGVCAQGVRLVADEALPTRRRRGEAPRREVIERYTGSAAKEVVRDGETGLLAATGDVEALARHVLHLAASRA